MSVRLGTSSPSSLPTVSRTLRLLSDIATRASSLHIDLLLLPEAFLGGYPRGSNFGSSIGGRSAEGREEYACYFENAVDLGDVVGVGGAGGGDEWLRRELPPDAGKDRKGEDGPLRGDGTREELEKIAHSSGVFLVVGVVERAGGSLYCSVVYVDPTRGMLGKRRKVLPTGTERLVWSQSHPSTLKAISTTIRGTRINLAAAICWESYMPLLRQSLYAQNVNLYLAPTADARDSWLSLMRTIGMEGRCFVVSSNMAVREPSTNGTNGTSSALAQQTKEARDEERGGRQAPPPLPPSSGRRLRRSSTITEDGNEIALPKCSPPISPTSKQRKRRKSVFDENGNEIVLCCDEDAPTTDDADHQLHEKTNGSKTNGHSFPKLVKTIFDTTSQVIDEEEERESRWACRGGSCIVSPFGDVLAGPQWEDSEGILHVDVDFRDCVKGRLDLDTAGSYSRNDAFRFSVEGLALDPLPYF